MSMDKRISFALSLSTAERIEKPEVAPNDEGWAI